MSQAPGGSGRWGVWGLQGAYLNRVLRDDPVPCPPDRRARLLGSMSMAICQHDLWASPARAMGRAEASALLDHFTFLQASKVSQKTWLGPTQVSAQA